MSLQFRPPLKSLWGHMCHRGNPKISWKLKGESNTSPPYASGAPWPRPSFFVILQALRKTRPIHRNQFAIKVHSTWCLQSKKLWRHDRILLCGARSEPVQAGLQHLIHTSFGVEHCRFCIWPSWHFFVAHQLFALCDFKTFHSEPMRFHETSWAQHLFWFLSCQHSNSYLHPWSLTWNLKIKFLDKKHTIMFMHFPVPC